MSFPVLPAEAGFEAATHVVLQYLHEQMPLALWSVTRVENDRQTFLHLNADNVYGKARGDSHAWADSFCIHMVDGGAPAVAPDAQAVPEYAAAGVNEALDIGAYAGAAIREPDGTLFGAICGLDEARRNDDAALASASSLVAMLGELLTMALAAERTRDAAAAAVLEANLAAETDILTGLHNRRAWERIVVEETDRFRRLADPTVAVMMDLDMLKSINDNEGHAAGDRHIRLAGEALLASVKETDVVARLGGDEFALLLRGCTEKDAEQAVERIYAALRESGVAGSLGWAPISVLKGLPEALAEADVAMYAAKRARRQARLVAR